MNAFDDADVVCLCLIQQRETALDIARRKDNDELIMLLTNVKVRTESNILCSEKNCHLIFIIVNSFLLLNELFMLSGQIQNYSSPSHFVGNLSISKEGKRRRQRTFYRLVEVN